MPHGVSNRSHLADELDGHAKYLQLAVDDLFRAVDTVQALEERIIDLEEENSDLEQELSQKENEIEELESRGRTAGEMLEDAVRAELAKFTFPEQDRPELYGALCRYEEAK